MLFGITLVASFNGYRDGCVCISDDGRHWVIAAAGGVTPNKHICDGAPPSPVMNSTLMHCKLIYESQLL